MKCPIGRDRGIQATGFTQCPVANPNGSSHLAIRDGFVRAMVDFCSNSFALVSSAAHKLNCRFLAWPGSTSPTCAAGVPALADPDRQAGSVFPDPAKGGPSPGGREWAAQRRKTPKFDAPSRLFRARRSKSSPDHEPRSSIYSTRSTRS